MTINLYQLRAVRHCYGQRCVLQLSQLDITPGEILAIVGPSGAGKSTLLRLLALLESPTQGDVYFSPTGEPYRVSNAPLEIRRQLAMVFQRPALMSRSVRANVAYGLSVRGRRDDAVVNQVLERVALSHLAQAKPRTLSGGEMQRVSLARALVIQPKVLLLDEPTASLDPANVRLIEDILRTQNEQHATTIILVTHNIFQARRIAHRVAFIYDSHLVEVSPTDTFFNNPRDPRTRDFLSGDLI